ncbi:MAG: hypothetical protein MMC23_000891 [Stictis urceolatum]|nr:hypothetical protein [Stictis urceolata]
MGKAGRIFCIAVPLALTLISLVFLVLIGLAQTNKDSNYLSNLYYVRANLSAAPASVTENRKALNTTDPAAKDSDGNIKIEDFYTIGLWNYCAGNGKNVSTSSASLGQSSAQKVNYCTSRQTKFAFDPEAAWGLDKDFTTKHFSDKLNSALDKYESTFSKIIGPFYILTVTSAGVTALISIAAIFSRLGSLATTIAASLTSLLSFVFAAVATAAYAVLAGAFNAALKDQKIHFSLGPSMFIYMWLTFAVSFVAMLFWALSSCCCSGKSSRTHKSKGHKGEYQNLHGGEAGYPMQTGGWSGQGAQAYGVGHGHHQPQGSFGGPAGGAYEPYRHQ